MVKSAYEDLSDDQKVFWNLDKFIPIPDTLIKIYKLNTAVVFGLIYNLSKRYGYSYSSINNMAYELGIDNRTINKAIELLLKEKLISDTTKKNWNHYLRTIVKKYRYQSRYLKHLRLYTPDPERLKEVIDNWRKYGGENESLDEGIENEDENINDFGNDINIDDNSEDADWESDW